jgi:hypothetical protein
VDVRPILARCAKLCDLGRFAEATTLLRSVVVIEPDNAPAWCLLAAAELGTGDGDAAERAASTATSLAPEMLRVRRPTVAATPQGNPAAPGLRDRSGGEAGDLGLRSLLVRCAYLVLLDAFLVTILTSASEPLGRRLLPIAVLAIPGILACRLVLGLQRGRRRSLVGLMVRELQTRRPLALEGLAVLCLIIGSIAPESVRVGLAGAAVLAAAAARVMLWRAPEVDPGDQRTGRPDRASAGDAVGTPALWLSTTLLATTAGIALFSISKVGLVGALVALVCAAGCLWTARVIRRRSATG